jgi:hypothetical protein
VSSDGACVYEVSSNYLEHIKRYGADNQKVNGRTYNPRNTIHVNCNTSRQRLSYKNELSKESAIFFDVFNGINGKSVT